MSDKLRPEIKFWSFSFSSGFRNFFLKYLGGRWGLYIFICLGFLGSVYIYMDPLPHVLSFIKIVLLIKLLFFMI